MKRTNWRAPIVIIIAFLVGIPVNILARHMLPMVLPGSLEKGSGLLSVLIQVILSAAIIFFAVRVKD